jgi:cathepsin B
MRSVSRIVAVCALLALASASYIPDRSPRPRPGAEALLSEDLVRTVNTSGALWRAKFHAQFTHMTENDAVRRLGASPQTAKLPVISHFNASIPDEWDAGNAFPGCLGAIRDQDQCGSCWAFSSAEAASDRLCIAKQGAEYVTLSPQYMVSCAADQNACDGGTLPNSWTFLNTSGTVTDACVPYTSGAEAIVPDCPYTCVDGTALDPVRTKTAYTVSRNPQTIQNEMMKNGPVQVGFNVYKDFYAYETGVYHHVTGRRLGYHAVKMVGWGVEDGVKYWRIANSWNTTWGEDGFFRIVRGTNECGIEANVNAGTF